MVLLVIFSGFYMFLSKNDPNIFPIFAKGGNHMRLP